MATSGNHREMFQSLPWPFPQNRFPAQLGAVVMRTVLEERWPALQVVHFPDNSWAIADGVHDPNERDACVATHIWHVIAQDRSLEELASLPIGSVADRSAVGEPWQITPFQWGNEEGD